MGEETLIKPLSFSGFLFSHENFGFDELVCFLLIQSPFELCLVASRRAIDGVIRPKLGQLLGMFDFPEKVKAWCDDVVSRAGRSYLPISK